ncbi:unnamed protein product, partial [Polarella glacialis]
VYLAQISIPPEQSVASFQERDVIRGGPKLRLPDVPLFRTVRRSSGSAPVEAVPIGCRCLYLHLTCLGNILLLALRDDAEPSDIICLPEELQSVRRPGGRQDPPTPRRLESGPFGDVELIADMSIADISHQFLHIRGIYLKVNGPWVHAEGFFSVPSGAEDIYAPSALTRSKEGSLCLVSLRD